MKRPILAVAASLLLLGGATWLAAQSGSPKSASKPKEYATMKLVSAVGSFWCEGEGHLEMTFRGTILVSNFEGAKLSVTGNVRKEWDKYGRQTWFADLDKSGNPAKLVIDGKWRRLNWFGRDLKANWHGAGIALLFGQFDEASGGTGTVQIDNGPIQPWFTSGTTHYLPPSPADRRSETPPPTGTQ